MAVPTIWKPWYVHRPSQIARRLWRRLGPRDGVRLVPLPWGGRLKVDTSRTVGRSLWETGVYEIATSEAMARLLRPGDLAVDIGANVGYMTVLMGTCVGPGGKVLAFEPHPDTFRSLRENIELARGPDFAEVLLYNEAVSDAPGQAELFVPDGFQENDGLASLCRVDGSQGVATVTTVVLDDLLEGQAVRLLKLDVEGHELSALRGAARLLESRSIEHILFEEHQGASSPVCDLLRGRGYTLFEVGWRLSGPRLATLDGPTIGRTYEAPNYLATLDPEGALLLCRPTGWRVLRRRLGRRAPGN